MIDLPEGWQIVALGDLVDVLDSKRVPLSAAERKHREGSVPYYGATGQVGTIDKHIFDEPLVLLGEDGVQFFDPYKPKAYKIVGPSWVNNHAHVLRPKSGVIEFGYLLHYLNAFDYQGYANGTTRLKLTQGAMNSIPVRLPTIADQRRIVETLDDHLSRLDKAKAELYAAHSRLDVFRRSAIEALTRGDETWTTSTLGDVTNVNWGDTSLTKSSYRDTGFTAFSASGPDGFIDKYDFDKDGVVLSAIGAACGKVFFASGKWSGIKNTICITPKDSAVSAKYLYYFLNDTNGWQKRGAAQPFIRQADARARTVRYPNPTKQQELIETLEAQITLFEILSKDLKNQIQQVMLLRRSVLKIAFEGNLRGQ